MKQVSKCTGLLFTGGSHNLRLKFSVLAHRHAVQKTFKLSDCYANKVLHVGKQSFLKDKLFMS